LDFIRQCREIYKKRGFRGHREVEKPMLIREAQELVDQYEKLDKFFPDGLKKDISPMCVECFILRCYDMFVKA
jgi:hypothetical protein